MSGERSRRATYEKVFVVSLRFSVMIASTFRINFSLLAQRKVAKERAPRGGVGLRNSNVETIRESVSRK